MSTVQSKKARAVKRRKAWKASGAAPCPGRGWLCPACAWDDEPTGHGPAKPAEKAPKGCGHTGNPDDVCSDCSFTPSLAPRFSPPVRGEADTCIHGVSLDIDCQDCAMDDRADDAADYEYRG